MSVPSQTITTPEQAAAVLGIEPGCGEAALRAAYLKKLKEHPPDGDPEGFERVRDAMQVLSDPGCGASVWFDVDPEAPLVSLLDEPCFVGPGPWLGALRRMVGK